MSHGWGTSTRRLRLPADWPKRRTIVLARCGYRCEWVEDGERCNARATDVDHKVRGDDHSLSNLQGLCAPHHKGKTAAEAAEGRRKFAASRYLPREDHPSLRRR